ncbi:uncharacterized protein LOC101240747 isoform X1 [Hydra vulgaris]|uniref:uncharacterized protein LOC101240747 isoform X1 n=1 Tax=Hydra vulgaris TaxID=6087 RepID=UPI001F5F1C58|nr:uncharacterized protein LOC101240747 isoform X1 [Hydra vulgaris]
MCVCENVGMSTNISNAAQNEAYAITFKIALATSIIRTKPSHLTLMQYINKLVKKIKSSEETWRTKAGKLQAKLNKARREIILLQLKNAKLDSNPSEMDIDFFVNSSKDSQKSYNIDIVPVRLKIKEEKYKCCDQFLMAVTSISNWYDTLKKDESYLEVIMVNLKQCIKDLEKSLQNISCNNHTVKALESCMKNIVEFLQNEKFSNDNELIKNCSHLGEVIIAKIMNSDEYTVKEQLSVLLLELSSSCQNVRDSCYDSLVKVICGYSMLLKDLSSFYSLDCKKYNSMFYICNTLRVLSFSTLSKWNNRFLGEYSCNLDSDLFKIAKTFPMYSHAVWNLSSIMADVHSMDAFQ